MRILSLSDEIVDLVYSAQARSRFGNIDLVIGCGDLPYYYQEYVVSCLDLPTFYVRGNHDKIMEYSEQGSRSEPHGATDLHLKTANLDGILLAGVEGSLRYRPGPFQYTQGEMWQHVFWLVPSLIKNRFRHGRYLDIFVTHSPPWGIHDQSDLPHQGIKAFLWLDRVFKPRIHFHGHTHVYRNDTPKETQFGHTLVINSYGYRITQLEFPFKTS